MNYISNLSLICPHCWNHSDYEVKISDSSSIVTFDKSKVKLFSFVKLAEGFGNIPYCKDCCNKLNITTLDDFDKIKPMFTADRKIADIICSLNKNGIQTLFSCQGHISIYNWKQSSLIRTEDIVDFNADTFNDTTYGTHMNCYPTCNHEDTTLTISSPYIILMDDTEEHTRELFSVLSALSNIPKFKNKMIMLEYTTIDKNQLAIRVSIKSSQELSDIIATVHSQHDYEVVSNYLDHAQKDFIEFMNTFIKIKKL